ncbi:MAG: ATP-binding domain-containing protein [Limisphaerales bacterium]
MRIIAYEGPAGTGKTTRLIQSLEGLLASEQLRDGQRVLALTFMHGSRRRLHERLSSLTGLRGRFECSTFDSFAFMVCNRWKSLLKRLGLLMPGDGEFDKTCDCCGALVEQAHARTWITCGFPTIVVDEAQDLSPERLRIVRGLAPESNLLIAADEFQCLDDRLIPNPAVQWLRSATTPIPLDSNYRTSKADLLAAALAVRTGSDVAVKNRNFKVVLTPKDVFAAEYVSNAIAWGGTPEVTIITPSRKGAFCTAIVELVGRRQSSKGNGPYRCGWECTDVEEVETTMRTLALPDTVSTDGLVTHLGNLNGAFPGGPVAEWADRQRRVSGQIHFDRGEVQRHINRLFSMRRHYSHYSRGRFQAMTVHQAKNREFDGVIVIWPHTVGGDAQHKRRLLYNAITRAKKWCLVLVQGKKALESPPFKSGT